MRIKLKEEWEVKLTWIVAHSVALLAEAVAIEEGLKSYHLNHSLLHAFVLPLLGIMPWLGAMAAMRRYNQMDEPRFERVVRRDISGELGGVVLSAYLLFIFTIIK